MSLSVFLLMVGIAVEDIAQRTLARTLPAALATGAALTGLDTVRTHVRTGARTVSAARPPRIRLKPVTCPDSRPDTSTDARPDTSGHNSEGGP